MIKLRKFPKIFVLISNQKNLCKDLQRCSSRRGFTVQSNSPLRKHTYSNILKILPPKNENFQIKKKSDTFLISAQNIDCGYLLEPPRRGSNEYLESMLLSRNEKNTVYSCKPLFYHIKVGFKGVKII